MKKLLIPLAVAITLVITACNPVSSGNEAVDSFLKAVQASTVEDASTAPQTFCFTSSAEDETINVGDRGLFTPVVVTVNDATEIYDPYTFDGTNPGSALTFIDGSPPLAIHGSPMTVVTEGIQVSQVRIRSLGGEAQVCLGEV